MSRNMNWTDNKVFGAQQQPNASNAGVMGFTYQEKPNQQVSPATYSEPKQQVSPATYSEPKQQVSPATFSEPKQQVSPATFSEPKQQVSPATYSEPKPQNTEVAGVQYIEPTANQNVAGVQYQEPQKYQDVAGAQYADPRSGVMGAAGGYPAVQPHMHNQTLVQAVPLMMTTPMSSGFMEQGPPPVTSPGYIPGYLKSLIGKPVRAEFSIGSNLLTDRTGIVREVGVNFFVLEDLVTRSRVMCDLYSVKFVTSL